MIVIGSFAWFFLLFLGFIKLMPSLSIVEVKETIPPPMKDPAMAATTESVLGVFAHVDTTVRALEELKAKGYHDLTVYTPLPVHEIEDVLERDRPVSRVRLFTLIGGLTGTRVGLLSDHLVVDGVGTHRWAASSRGRRSRPTWSSPSR